MKTQREMHCRACEHQWDAEAWASELPLTCPSCGSDDTFSAVGTAQFELRHYAGDKCGWALSGYTKEKHIDLRDRPIGTKEERWAKVKN